MSKIKKIKKKKSVGKEIEPSSLDLTTGVLDGILDTCGAGSAQLLGSDGLKLKIRGVISTQSATIDAAIGRGGVPRGRLTIINGPEGGGKTTFALHLVAETQRLGGVAIYVDKEYKLDPEYASNIGVNTDKLIIAQPPYLEKAFELFDGVIKRAAEMREKGKRVPILIVLDSMNAAITKDQYDGTWEQKHIAPQAAVFSRLLPKLISLVSAEDVSLVWISQVRNKIAVKFGDPTDIAGGNAPRFYASLILSVYRSTTNTVDGEKIGNEIIVNCIKNQIAPPFRKAQCEIVYGKGFNKTDCLLDQAEKDGLIERSGGWYSYGDERLGHGKIEAIQKIDECYYDEIMKKIEDLHGWER